MLGLSLGSSRKTRIEQRLVLEMSTGSNEQLWKILGSKVAFAYGGREPSPQRVARKLQSREGACRRFHERIVHSAAEPSPKVDSLGCSSVRQSRRWRGREDLDKVGFRIVGEVDICHRGSQEGVGWRAGHNEDCR